MGSSVRHLESVAEGPEMAKKTGARSELSKSDKEARHYEVLGLPSFSSPEDVEEAHSSLAKTLMPATDGGDAPAAERLAAVNAAYQILSNPDTKQQYDKHLAARIPNAGSSRTEPEPTARAQATPNAGPSDDIDKPSIGNPRGRNVEPPFTSNALYRPGERVRHGSFGSGQVTSTKQVADGQVVQIAFEDTRAGSRDIYNRFDGLTHL